MIKSFKVIKVIIIIIILIDLRKAHDSVNRDLLWKAMREYGITEKIVKILNSLYDNTRAKVRVIRIFVFEDWSEAGLCAIAIVVQYFHGLGGEEDEGYGREGN